jgi:hypothetical protein
MNTENPLADIANVIQLSIAPVFLLTSLGTFLAVLNTRLGRITDRARALEARALESPSSINPKELTILRRRRKLVNVAISFSVFAALSVCVLIASAFIASLVKVNAAQAVAAMFITAMFAFIVGLVTFLAEIRLALVDAAFDPKP